MVPIHFWRMGHGRVVRTLATSVGSEGCLLDSAVASWLLASTSWSNSLAIKSPRYTGGDFMFLYRSVRCRCRPQILVHAITFEQLLGFLSFLPRLLALTCRLPDKILVNFHHDLDLDFSRSNMEFAISQPKMVRLPRSEKQTYRLNSCRRAVDSSSWYLPWCKCTWSCYHVSFIQNHINELVERKEN